MIEKVKIKYDTYNPIMSHPNNSSSWAQFLNDREVSMKEHNIDPAILRVKVSIHPALEEPTLGHSLIVYPDSTTGKDIFEIKSNETIKLIFTFENGIKPLEPIGLKIIFSPSFHQTVYINETSVAYFKITQNDMTSRGLIGLINILDLKTKGGLLFISVPYKFS